MNPRALSFLEKLKPEEIEIYDEKKLKELETTYMNSFKPYKIIQTEVKKHIKMKNYVVVNILLYFN